MGTPALHEGGGRGVGTGTALIPRCEAQRRARPETSTADAGSRGSPPRPERTPEDTDRRSAGDYWVAVDEYRWRRPADEQERSRLMRMAVDRGAEPQTVRVISAPLVLDGWGHPEVGRSSCCRCAVVYVTRLKDAAPAVSRICGRGSPIPISAQVRDILETFMHRCTAAIGSAHRRASPRFRAASTRLGPTASWSLAIDSVCQMCATTLHLLDR